MVDLELLERRLLRTAMEESALTYGELLAFFERRVTRITVAALCRDLGRVCRRIEAAGGPDVACLVVRKADRLPGEGYFQSLREESGYAGPSGGAEAVALVRARQARAFAFARAGWPDSLDRAYAAP
jgi:hypothetical protein